MSNAKIDATFHGGNVSAEVHSVRLFDAVCYGCGWQADGNPFATAHEAYAVADAHVCPIP